MRKKVHICASEETLKEHEDFISGLKEEFESSPLKGEELKDDSFVVLLGGDGSLNYLFNNISNFNDLRIIYFPCGTANDFAKSLKITPSTPTVEKVKEILDHCPLAEIPVMKCNDRHFINAATGGAPARVTSSGEDLLKKLTGKISYYVSALEEIISPNQIELRYSVNDKDEKEIKTYGFIVSQGLFAGGGVKVTPSFTPAFQRHFNFLTADSDYLSESLGTILKIQNFDGARYRDSNMIGEAVRKLTIKSHEEVPLKLDGEEYAAKELTFVKADQIPSFYIY